MVVPFPIGETTKIQSYLGSWTLLLTVPSRSNPTNIVAVSLEGMADHDEKKVPIDKNTVAVIQRQSSTSYYVGLHYHPY